MYDVTQENSSNLLTQLRQVSNVLQNQFSTESDLVFPLSISSILRFP